MAYIPTLDDIKETEDSNYEPSLKDIPTGDEGSGSLIQSMPTLISAALQALPNMANIRNHPIDELTQRLAAMGRGFTDVGEGLKQTYLTSKEKLGYAPPGTAENYTNQADEERNLYDRTPAGHNYIANILRNVASSAPYMVTPVEALGAEGSLISKMLKLGAPVGAIKGAEYTPQNEEAPYNLVNPHVWNALKGVAIGGAIPAAMPAIMKTLEGFVEPLTSRINPAATIENTLQKSADDLLNSSSDIYNNIKKAVVDRGISKINIDPELINKAEASLPKTKSTKSLIEKARTGDYTSIHKLQSDLGKKGLRGLRSDTMADNDAGAEILDTRDDINNEVNNHFIQTGNDDLVEALKSANEKYRKLKDLYYSNNTIGKMVDPKLREIPKEPFNVFNVNSIPLKKVLEEHPQLAKDIFLYNRKKQLLKALGLTGTVSLASYGLPKIYNYIKD